MQNMKLLTISLLLTLPVFGQVPGIPGIPPVQPPKPGVPNGPLPVAARAPGVPDPDAIAIANGQAFDYENMTGQEAANLYHRHTGIRVIVQSAAGQAELRIFQPGPLTNAEVASILEKQLLLEGFSLIPSGENEVKLVRSDQNPSGADVYSHGSELPAGDEYVTYVMQLQYLKPVEAVAAFGQIVVSMGGGGKVAAVPNAASVVISANTAVIRMLIALQKEIDVPSSTTETRFVAVTYADVENLAERLNEIFNDQKGSRSSAAVQRAGTPRIPGLVANRGQTTSAGEDSPVNILPDARTNRIFLMGRPVDLVFIEGLIKEFDAPTSSRNFLVRRLTYLPVLDFLPIAADALARTIGASSSSGGGAGGSSRNSSNRSSGSNNRNTSNNSFGNNNGGGGGGSQAQLSQQSVDVAPESMVIEDTLLVANNISNSIIVKGPPHHVEIIENLIAELDQASEQVAITAVFGRYDVTDGGSFGVDLAHIVENIAGDFSLGGRTRTGVPSVIDPGTLGTITELLTGSGAGTWGGLSLYGQLGSELGIFVNAVEDHSNFVAIARPTVFTKNNHEARISSGSRIAVPTSTFTGNVNGGNTTNVEFQDVVLELLVRPLVNDENTVTLEISLVRDDIGENRAVGDLIVPDIITDQLTTTVTVPNRSTIILGGLITEANRMTKSGVPILSSIPGIGRLFSTETESTEKQELVIMIHASIITNDAQLDDYQREYDAESSVATDARATMGGQGVLPQRGLRAAPLYDKGNNTPPSAPIAPVEQPRRATPFVSTSPSQVTRQKTRANSLKNKRRR